MNIKTLFITLAAVSMSVCAEAQTAKVKDPGYQFTDVKRLPVTSVKNQNRSGTCWCFSSLSFIEAEVIKARGIKDEDRFPDLSEMFVVRHAYHDRAVSYVRRDGCMNFAAGSDFGDVFEVIKKYGIVPQSAYSGMNYGTELPVQGELDAVLKGYVDAVVKNPNKTLTPVWANGFDGILDAYLGEVPATFTDNGVTYTPESYRDALGLNWNDYVGFCSFTHEPYYEPTIIEVADNWRNSTSYNIPLDDFVAIVDYAIDNGYTVLWGGDVSEKGFNRDGLGILVADNQANTGSDQARWVGNTPAQEDTTAARLFTEEEVTPESRQTGYDNKSTTDDHGMHLIGTAKDQNGAKYYIIKNSWGTKSKYEGYWYMSENFFKAKTLNYVVNKNAIPKDLRKKLGIK